MADNLKYNEPGAGPLVATDDVAGVQFQKMKLDGGGDGASAPILGDSAQGLDVDPTRGPPDITASGSFTANGQSLELVLGAGIDSVGVQITGTWSGGVQFEAQTEIGSTWVVIYGINATGPAHTSNSSANGLFTVGVGGFAKFRLTSQAWVSGTAALTLRGSAGGNLRPTIVIQTIASNLQAQVQGNVAHDAPEAGNPILIGARASAAAPANVSTDGDRVRLWALLNGQLVIQIGAAGALVGGDAANGLDVDVTRLPYDIAHGATDSGNPIKIGGRAIGSGLFTKLTAGQRSDLATDLYGRPRVIVSEIEHALSGVYRYQTGAHLVLATADATTAGRWFLINTSATVKVLLCAIIFTSQHGTVLATPTSPRLVLRFFTFTGTPSGAVISPAKSRTGDATATGSLRTANTGMTISGQVDIHGFLPCAALTPVGGVPNASEVWAIEDGKRGIELGQNEGIVCQQMDNGTASDTRRYLTNLVTAEYTP